MGKTAFVTGVAPGLSDYDTLRAQFHRMVAGEVYRSIGNPLDVEEQTEKVFKRVWKRRKKFNPARSSLSPWIYLSIRTVVIEYYRRWREPALRLDLVPEDVGPSAEGPEATYRVSERLREVRDAVACLPWPDSEVMRLRHIEGLPWDEVTRQTRISLRTAHYAEERARELLKVKLGPVLAEAARNYDESRLGRVGLLHISSRSNG